MRSTWQFVYLIFFLNCSFSVDAEKCVDRITSCHRIKHLCDHVESATEQNCPLTCGLCNSTSLKECEDNPRCPTWFPTANCADDLPNEQRRLCPRLCGSCGLKSIMKVGSSSRKRPRPSSKPRPAQQPRHTHSHHAAPSSPRSPHHNPQPEPIRTPYVVFERSLNTSVHPCVDFYEFTCGGYISHHRKQSSTQDFSVARETVERAKKQKMAILTNRKRTTSTAIRKVLLFRDKCMNVGALETERTHKLWKTMQSIGQGFPMLVNDFNPTTFRLEHTLHAMAEATGREFWYKIEAKKMVSDKVFAIIKPPDLLISTPTLYYGEHGQQFANSLAGHLLQIVQLFAADQGISANFVEVRRDVVEIVKLDRTLAQKVAEGQRNQQGSGLSSRKVSELSAEIPGINWDYYLENHPLIPPEVETHYFALDPMVHLERELMLKAIDAVFRATNRRVVANYLFIRFIFDHGPYDSRLMALKRQFANRVGRPINEPPRDEHCYNSIVAGFPVVVEHLYAKYHLKPNALSTVHRMIGHLRSSMSSMLGVQEWMSPEIIDRALSKLTKMRTIVGILNEDKKEENLDKRYEELELKKQDSWSQAVVKLRKYDKQKQLMQLVHAHLAALPHTYEHMSHEAVYIPNENAVFLNTRLFQPPIFDPAQPAAVNYGSIGFVVGHEFTHGFDHKGALNDENGRYRKWWDAKTQENYDEKSQSLVDLYDQQVEPTVDRKVDGKLTLTENIADSGGIRAAFRAYILHNLNDEHRVKGFDQYTPQQAFFIAYGTFHCDAYSNQQIEHYLRSDPHAPSRFRVNTVLANYDEFAKAFECAPGTPMNPGTRYTIWSGQPIQAGK